MKEIEVCLENVRENELLAETRLVEIFTNTEAKSKKVDCTWFYQVLDEYGVDGDYLTKEALGNSTLCCCDECKSFGVELFEFFSVYLALKYVNENAPEVSILLWVSSEKFLLDEKEGVLSHYSEIYGCAFPRTLGNDLTRLLQKLDVEILHYSYANKDIIPVFF